MVLCVTGLSGAVLLFIMSLPSLEGLEGLEHPRWLTHGWSWCNPNWEGQPELLGAPSCGLSFSQHGVRVARGGGIPRRTVPEGRMQKPQVFLSEWLGSPRAPRCLLLLVKAITGPFRNRWQEKRNVLVGGEMTLHPGRGGVDGGSLWR